VNLLLYCAKSSQTYYFREKKTNIKANEVDSALYVDLSRKLVMFNS